MKKITVRIFTFVLLLVQFSCSSNQLRVTQVPSDYPIILMKGKNAKRVTAIRIPLVFKMSNYSFNIIELIDPVYWHKSQFSKSNYSGWCTLYTSKNRELLISEKIEKLGLISQKFVVYIGHRSCYDGNDKFGKFFQPYFDYMVEKDKDTLHISSIQELKKTNPEILNAFLQGDSILFRFYKGKSIFTRTFPVEVK